MIDADMPGSLSVLIDGKENGEVFVSVTSDDLAVWCLQCPFSVSVARLAVCWSQDTIPNSLLGLYETRIVVEQPSSVFGGCSALSKFRSM
jgi:hypothetical protein